MKDELQTVRERLIDLELQHDTGFVNDEQYAEYRAILERRLVAAALKPSPQAAVASPAPSPENSAARRHARLLFTGLLVLSAAAVGLAWWLWQGSAKQAVAALAPQPAPPVASTAAEPAAPEASATTPGQPSPIAAQGTSLAGVVTLAPALQLRVDPNDTLIVYALALEGPAKPLALMRAKVKDLPLKFELNDGMAIWTTDRLSSFSQVRVVARISKSGARQPKSGDLQGQVAPVTLGRSDLLVEIDTLLPP